MAQHNEVGLLEGLATTRAIRRYRPDADIPTEDLNEILFAATRAPTGSNRQGFRFVVLRDGPNARRAKALLGDAFRSSWGTKRANDGYDAGSGTQADTPKAQMARTMQHFVDNVEATPVIVLACLKLHHEESLEMGGHVFPACQNLLLAARALGYGGVLTGWHKVVDAELRDVIGMPTDPQWRIAACITLGVPAGRHGPVRRRPLADSSTRTVGNSLHPGRRTPKAPGSAPVARRAEGERIVRG